MKRPLPGFPAFALALLAAAGLLLGRPAGAGETGQHTHAKPAARPELGSSAAFGPDGALYVARKRGEHVVLERSLDAGATWDEPVVVNGAPEAISAEGENRPKLAFASDGAVLVAWTHPLAKPYTGEIRFARSIDGKHFADPVTVHRDRSEITHRFESMRVAPDGRVVLAWVDKRDLEAAKAARQEYGGAAIYAAVSRDGGQSFAPEQKIADHSCECCRIALADDADGATLMLWRHVFGKNERDHALTRLSAEGKPEKIQRATFDHWQLDGCPHHGPSLAVAPDGTRHAVWFDQREGEGRVFYGRLPRREGKVEGQRPVGSPTAEHADLALAGRRLALAWKEFDGQAMRLRAEVSEDGGRSFRALELASSAGASDQPRLLTRGTDIYVFWNSEGEGMRLFRIQ